MIAIYLPPQHFLSTIGQKKSCQHLGCGSPKYLGNAQLLDNCPHPQEKCPQPLLLKKVKTFLRNTIPEDRLNALALLSIEKNLIRDSIDFNQNVIDIFAQLKNRRARFRFK